MIEALSSFALSSTWLAPEDDGGRPVINYVVKIYEEGVVDPVVTQDVDVTPMPSYFINDMVIIMPSTDYT